MTQYSVQPRERIFVKGYGYLSFAKNMGKNTIKNLSPKQSQELLDHAKQSATEALKTSSQRVIQKTAVATGNLIGNKIADKIAKVSRNSHKIIQRQLQMSMTKIYLKKNIYLQKKDSKLLMN